EPATVPFHGSSPYLRIEAPGSLGRWAAGRKSFATGGEPFAQLDDGRSLGAGEHTALGMLEPDVQLDPAGRVATDAARPPQWRGVPPEAGIGGVVDEGGRLGIGWLGRAGGFGLGGWLGGWVRGRLVGHGDSITGRRWATGGVVVFFLRWRDWTMHGLRQPIGVIS